MKKKLNYQMKKTINKQIKEQLRNNEEQDARQAMTNLMVTVFGGEQIIGEEDKGNKIKFEGLVDKVKQLIEFHNRLDQHLAQLENTMLAIARSVDAKPEDVAEELFNEDGQYLWELNFKEAIKPIIERKQEEMDNKDNTIVKD